MTYNALIPLNSDSPSIFPAQAQTNFTRLQTIVSADHQFNLSAAADDGYHNLIRMTQQAPSGALAATGRLYVKTAGSFVQLFYMDDNGRAYQITPGIIACVNFDGTSIPGAQTIRSSSNVLSVVKTNTGVYKINFVTAIANSNYVAVVTGMRSNVGEVYAFIVSDGVYNDNATTTFINVAFQANNGSLQDVLMGNVLIYSVA